MDINKSKLLLGKPIYIDAFGTIYQPTLDEILDYDNYQLVNLIFSTDIEMVGIENRELYKNFDVFFFKDVDGNYVYQYEGISMIDILIDILKFYLKKEDIFLYQKKDMIPIVVLDDNHVLYRDNFDELAKVMLLINHTEKASIEKPPKLKNEKHKDIWEKLKKGRERQAEKRGGIETIINEVIHCGRSYISYKEIVQMTMYQLFNSYESIMKIDRFYTNFKQYLVGVSPDKLDLTHWSEALTIK